MKIRLGLITTLLFSVNLAFADGMKHYEVSITNITKGQTFTPQLAATHNDTVSLFSLGQSASSPLELLAESGDTEPFTTAILTVPDKVGFVQTVPGLLAPGKTATFEINSSDGHYYLSFAAMLLPTNDTFVALNGVKLPDQGSVSYSALAYDAGTEENDQNCAHIPGPRCGGEAHSLGPNETDEGFVYVSNGFHELGNVDTDGNDILGPKTYDWRGAVAYVTIKRVNNN